MSMHCEEVRPLLAELVYDEIDPGLAEKLREHLGTCLACRRHQMAYLSVRQDLQEWQPAEESTPHGMTFIAPGVHAAPPIWHSRVFQGLAAAAGFMFLAVLTAAATNMQVQSGPDGWAFSSNFGRSASFDDTPATVSVDQIEGLDPWFNTRFNNQLGGQLTERGVLTLASMPQQQFLTDGQVQQVNTRFADMINTSLEERDLELTSRMETEFDNMRYYVDASLEDQNDAFFYTVANIVDGMESEHSNQVFEITQQFSSLYSDTDRRLEQANHRIDNLMSLAAPTRSPEQ